MPICSLGRSSSEASCPRSQSEREGVLEAVDAARFYAAVDPFVVGAGAERVVAVIGFLADEAPRRPVELRAEFNVIGFGFPHLFVGAHELGEVSGGTGIGDEVAEKEGVVGPLVIEAEGNFLRGEGLGAEWNDVAAGELRAFSFVADGGRGEIGVESGVAAVEIEEMVPIERDDPLSCVAFEIGEVVGSGELIGDHLVGAEEIADHGAGEEALAGSGADAGVVGAGVDAPGGPCLLFLR